jgi:hypothetical protein
MNTQAVLFYINDWNTNDCRKWLNNHDYIPLKRVHKTNTFFRYRIIQPNYNKYVYRIKTIQKYPLIKIILQYNK